MKLIIVLCFVLISSRAEDDDKDLISKFVQKIKKVTEECIEETKASSDDVKTILSHHVPESHEGKCLIFCFHKHVQIQNEDGDLNKIEEISALEAVKEHNKEIYDKVITVFHKCADSTSKDEDSCVYAGNLAECAIKEGKSLGLDELLVVE